MFSIYDFSKEETGQGMVEYGMILALITLVVIGAFSSVAQQIDNGYQYIIRNMSAITSHT